MLPLVLVIASIAGELRIGDPIHFQLDLPAADSVLVVEPAGLPVRVLPIKPHLYAKGGTLEFAMAAYDTGSIAIPPLAVLVFRAGEVTDTVWTDARLVAVVPTLADTATAPLPIKPYEQHPFRLVDAIREYWPWVLGALCIAALVYLYRRYRKRPVEGLDAVPVPVVPPAELAVRELIVLRDKRYPERGMIKEQYSEFSEIMRRYVEGRFAFPALEMTTYELANEFRRAEMPTLFADELLPLLRTADLVKFAKEIPTLAAATALVETGFTVVERTKPEPAGIPEAAAK
ncbi:MAG: hypothetical protein IPH10_02915 [bacterium]|nr:hypothetical protein [bacterium]